MHAEISIPELTEVITRLSAGLGARQGGVRAGLRRTGRACRPRPSRARAGALPVNNEFADADEDCLLEVYFGGPATPRRKATLKLFRFMSDLREAMWGVVQTSVSDLDFDFETYATKHFERLAQTSGDQRFRAWLREAGGSSS